VIAGRASTLSPYRKNQWYWIASYIKLYTRPIPDRLKKRKNWPCLIASQVPVGWYWTRKTHDPLAWVQGWTRNTRDQESLLHLSPRIGWWTGTGALRRLLAIDSVDFAEVSTSLTDNTDESAAQPRQADVAWASLLRAATGTAQVFHFRLHTTFPDIFPKNVSHVIKSHEGWSGSRYKSGQTKK
jgi:hypothetical protein